MGTSGRSEQDIFTAGSRTYSTAARFFSSQQRAKITDLYSFVRVADDLVDRVPQDAAGFHRLRQTWDALNDLPYARLRRSEADTLTVRVVKNISRLIITDNLERGWVETFLDSIAMDISPGFTYKTMDDTLRYIDGSAEVIGLMMCRILRVPDAAEEAARCQGRAMQYINFIRDIAEDEKLGRCYFPQTELAAYGIAAPSRRAARDDPDAFAAFVRGQLAYYRQWQAVADAGMRAIPRRQRIAVRTAVDGYNWTARQIEADPSIVWRCKVRPSKRQLFAWASRNALRIR